MTTTNIIRGTTPTLLYKFKVVDVSDITTAYLTIKEGDDVVIEKSLSDATVGEDTLSWRLEQNETLMISVGQVMAMINWVTVDGTRGASTKTMFFVEGNHIEEVI